MTFDHSKVYLKHYNNLKIYVKILLDSPRKINNTNPKE